MTIDTLSALSDIESDYLSADTLLACLGTRIRRLGAEQSPEALRDLRKARTALLTSMRRLETQLTEAARVRQFEMSLEDLPF